MSVEDNKAIVVRWIEEIALSGSVDKFDEILADDYQDRSGGVDKQGLKDAIAKFTRERPTISVKVDAVICEHDTVASRVSYFEGDEKIGEGFKFHRLVGGMITDDWHSERWLSKA